MSDNELNKLFIAQEKVDHDFIEVSLFKFTFKSIKIHFQ